MSSFLIVGGGGIATLIGYYLQTGGAHVSMLVRNTAAKEKILEFGVTLRYPDGSDTLFKPDFVVNEIDETDKPDATILAINGYPDQSLISQLTKIADNQAPIITLMNGIGHDEVLKQALPGVEIGCGTAMVTVEPIADHHYLVHRAAKIEIALVDGSAKDHKVLRAIQNCLITGGIVCTLENDLNLIVWRKLLWNVPLSGLGILYQPASIGQILDDIELSKRVHSIQNEILVTAQTLGLELNKDDIAKHTRETELVRAYRYAKKNENKKLELKSIFLKPLNQAKKARCVCPFWEELVDQLVQEKHFKLEHPMALPAVMPNQHQAQNPAPPIKHEDLSVTSSIIMHFIKVTDSRIEQCALEDRFTSRNYGELLATMYSIMRTIKQANIVSGTKVGIYSRNGIQFSEAMLGTWASGNIAVPLDPELPKNRLQEIAQDLHIDVILVESSLTDIASATFSSATFINLATSVSPLVKSDLVSLTPNAGAVILCTSGSEGRAKYILHTHISLMQNTQRHLDVMDLDTDDRMASFYNSGVYGATRDLILALSSGASLYFYPVAQIGVATIGEWLENNKITVFAVVISIFRAISDALENGQKIKSIRLIKCGGETIRSDDVRRFRNFTVEGAWFLSGLSSTELGLVLENRVGHAGTIPSSSLPLGRAFGMLKALVVDKQGRSVPDGVTGTLAIIGKYIPAGYITNGDIQRPELPLETSQGLASWWTSDLVTRCADGVFEYVGRSDSMVKIRGYRIDLGEIESRALMLSEIKSAVASIHKLGASNKVVLHWSRAKDCDINEDKLSDHLRLSLPSVAIPSNYIHVAEMPKLNSGKVDRRQLPSPKPRIGKVDGITNWDNIDPSGLLESIIEMFERAVGVRGISLNSSFTTVGGDSLTAIALILDIEEFLGTRLPFSIMESDPSPQDIFNRIKDAGVDVEPDLIFNYDKVYQHEFQVLCLPGVGGSLMQYRALFDEIRLRSLPISLLGARYPQLDSDTKHSNLTSIADDIVQALTNKGIQPTVIIGYSMGGLLAAELTSRLECSPTIIILDIESNRKLRFKTKIIKYFSSKYQPDSDQIKKRYSLIHNHKPTIIPSPVIVVKGLSDDKRRKKDLGWKPYAEGTLKLVELPFRHNRLLREEAAPQLCNILAEALGLEGGVL
jgi:2-dehydropantoate 2-reductase